MRHQNGWFFPEPDPRHKKDETPLRQFSRDVLIIDIAMRHAARRACAIQAGARVGIWPALLSEHYEQVLAFEPETRNYDCALLNLTAYPGVSLRKAALGNESRSMWVERSSVSSGSHQIVTDPGEQTEPCEVVTIDSLNASPDAIFLDIEGFELYALQGAVETLKRCHPMLVLEINDARLRYGISKEAITKWLSDFGYRVVDRLNKDFVFI